jgi:hypothetical protein
MQLQRQRQVRGLLGQRRLAGASAQQQRATDQQQADHDASLAKGLRATS